MIDVDDFPHDLLAGGTKTVSAVLARWNAAYRHYHSAAHLEDVLRTLKAGATQDRAALTLAALYHDAVYVPGASDNEDRSARLLLHDALKPDHQTVVEAVEIIRASSWKEAPRTGLVKRFFDADTAYLAADYEDVGGYNRVQVENGIMREHQAWALPSYKAKRQAFLSSWLRRFPDHHRGVRACLEILRALKPTVWLYPGTFNPFHRGHLSILKKAEQMADKVIIGVADSPSKGFSVNLPDRVARIQRVFAHHEVLLIDGLISEATRSRPDITTIVRGIRDGTDAEAELRYARFLDELGVRAPVVWVGCDQRYQHVSSTAVRELAHYDAHHDYSVRKRDVYGVHVDRDEPQH